MEVETGYRFLCGAEMHPSAIRADYPGARFVARARLPGNGAANDAAGDGDRGAADADVWGVLIAGAGAPGVAEVAEVVTDDGRAIRAAVSRRTPPGEPAAVLAAARYWELDPAYVARLAADPAAGADHDQDDA